MSADFKTKYLLALVPGLALGLAIGLFVTWQLWPVEYYNTDPVDLRAEHKEDYVIMIAAAHAQDHDPVSAGMRLEELGFEDPRQTVLGLFQRYSKAGYEEEGRSLARLAHGIGVEDVALLPYVATPTASAQPIVSPTIAPSPTEPIPAATATPTEPPPEPTPSPTEAVPEVTPTPTEPRPEPTSTPLPPAGEVDFQLVERADLGCTTDWGANYILVYLQDEHGRGLAGAQVIVSGAGHEDSFFTGLKPEVDPGFADFLVSTPGTYAVKVLDGTSQMAEGLTFADDCPTENPYKVWRIAFRRVSQ